MSHKVLLKSYQFCHFYRREELPRSMLLQSLQRESQIVRNFKFNVHETSQRCMSCKIRPRDACFVHTKITHQVCCMKCAKQIYQSNNKRCPICYRRIEKITKNIVAWEHVTWFGKISKSDEKVGFSKLKKILLDKIHIVKIGQIFNKPSGQSACKTFLCWIKSDIVVCLIFGKI